ncbi:type II toxin-antitoxin system RelE/ParE family toxin [Dyella telluris]|uniref:type II toxin-antitoxin system RelE/ParE family toxin n=1 Tax=Dyella telluris TaxID=2763498 RepID=UPI00236899CE|nr:type II toxin-antitoxin system RelE/ParE family toxin [Dyella telluris]
MIVSFRHKGLQTFYATGSTRGIQAAHAGKLGRILQVLDAATQAHPKASTFPAIACTCSRVSSRACGQSR